MKQSGFTLIELMAVITIIGILAAIAIPQYADYTLRSRYAESMVLAKPIQEKMVEYFERWGEFPRNASEAGLGDLSGYLGNYTEKISVQEGVIEFIFNENASPKRLWLQAAIADIDGPVNSVIWLCMSDANVDGLILIGEYEPTDTSADPVPRAQRPGFC